MDQGTFIASSQVFALTSDNLTRLKTWGQAYHNATSQDTYSFVSMANPDREINPLHSHMPVLGTNLLGVRWPDASSHPLFYVGIYAAIGFASTAARVFSFIAQYTGALRASRILFKYVSVLYPLSLLIVFPGSFWSQS